MDYNIFSNIAPAMPKPCLLYTSIPIKKPTLRKKVGKKFGGFI